MRAIATLMRLCSLALCVAAVAVLALGTARAQSIDFGRYHALVIGNDDYEHWTTLTTAVRDAQEVAKTLGEKYGFKVRLLENATASKIVRALNQLRSELTEVDNLLIYYAGHGHLDGETGFWIGIDGDKNFEDSWVSVSTITRNLDRMSARHVLVVADSCFSGTLTRGDDDAGLRTGRERSAWLGRMTTKRARLALTSGGLEPVSDVGGGGHSVFAKEFLDALRENDQVLEGQALFGRIKQDVVLNADQTPDYGKIRLAGDDGGDFLFVPRDLQVAAVAEQQNFGPQRGAGEDLGEDFRVWSVVQHSTNPTDLETFIATFPDSVWVPFARNRLAKLAADEPPRELALPPGKLPPESVPSPVEPTVGNYPVPSAPGSVFRDCPECPEMVVVPAGEFIMGAPPSESGRFDDEGPEHKVTIPAPFAVGRYEVTFTEWDACVVDGGCTINPYDFLWGRGDRPVIKVSWNEAQAYVLWLSQRTGESYRLLSEAEWEYVARAGSATTYWWGRDIGHENANCDGCGSEWDNEQTAPVGSFDANAFGLHDTAGNVWEWTEDCWHDSYEGAPGDGSAWTTGGDCDWRVLRGGSWNDEQWVLRSALRDGNDPGHRSDDVGFRVARAIDFEARAALREMPQCGDTGAGMAAREARGMLKEAQKRQYDHEGWLFLPSVFGADEATMMVHEAQQIYAVDRQEVFREKDGKTARTAFAAHTYNEVFRRLARHPRLIGPIEQVLRDRLYVHQFKLNAKAAFDGDQWQWHQDFGVWHRDDGMPEARAMNIAVFLDPVTEFNGPLMFIPQSHKKGVLEAGHDVSTTSYPLWTLDHATVRKLADQFGLMAPKGPAGSVLMFHGCLAHASPGNISPYDRTICYVTYCAVENHITRFKRPEWIAHRDFTAIEPLADDCLAELIAAQEHAAE